MGQVIPSYGSNYHQEVIGVIMDPCSKTLMDSYCKGESLNRMELPKVWGLNRVVAGTRQRILYGV